jgi:hypothetical protein
MNKYFFCCLLVVCTSAVTEAQVPPPPPLDTANMIKDKGVFVKVEVEAVYPGGEKMWSTYLSGNLNPEVPIQQYAPPRAYTVVVQFLVDKEGNIEEINPLTNHGFGMEEEVVRVIKNGPKWTPAMVNGKPVRAYRKQPVTFVVDSDFTLSTYTIIAGVDNKIKLNIPGVSTDQADATLSEGTIRRENDGEYIIRINQPGRILLTAWDLRKKKRNELGKVSILVK